MEGIWDLISNDVQIEGVVRNFISITNQLHLKPGAIFLQIGEDERHGDGTLHFYQILSGSRSEEHDWLCLRDDIERAVQILQLIVFSGVFEIASFDCASNWIETTYGTLNHVRISMHIYELIENIGQRSLKLLRQEESPFG